MIPPQCKKSPVCIDKTQLWFECPECEKSSTCEVKKAKEIKINIPLKIISIDQCRKLIEDREDEGIYPTIKFCWVCMGEIHHGGEHFDVNGKLRWKHKRCKSLDAIGGT